jgi:hypothetical protein
VRQYAGEARIYAIAVEVIRQSDGRLDRRQLAQFLNSYQRVAPLTISVRLQTDPYRRSFSAATNSAGVSTRMPCRSEAMKCRRLSVTITAAPAARATSAMCAS